MYRSNRSFNIPRAYPGRLTVHLVPGRGGGTSTLPGRVGNLNQIYLLCRRNTPVSFFAFLQGLTDLQVRISPSLVNSSFKRVFKRSQVEGVITAYLPLRSVNSV